MKNGETGKLKMVFKKPRKRKVYYILTKYKKYRKFYCGLRKYSAPKFRRAISYDKNSKTMTERRSLRFATLAEGVCPTVAFLSANVAHNCNRHIIINKNFTYTISQERLRERGLVK